MPRMTAGNSCYKQGDRIVLYSVIQLAIKNGYPRFRFLGIINGILYTKLKCVIKEIRPAC